MAAPAELRGVTIHSLQNKMAHHIFRLHQIFPAQELIARYSIHLHVEIMHENMRLWVASLLAPRKHPRREDGRHPPRRLRPIPSRPIHQYHIPVHLVQLVRQIIQTQFTLREQEILHGAALVPHLLLHRRYQLRHLAQFRGVLHVVGFDFRVLLLNVRRVVAVLVDEYGSAVVVEGFPEEGFVGEAEDEEVAGLRALPESVGNLLDVGVRHAVGVVGVGRVVNEGPGHGTRQRGAGGGHRGGDGGSGGDGFPGVDECDEEG
ncbi:hypothetical protein Pfo_019399 [Paulownia fortunei]|nr:hypothetical protein Pfo_019399 [Paulownia fortunei]